MVSLAMIAESGKYTRTQIEREYSLEISDLLAWLIGAANFYGLSLENAVVSRFGKGCWKCRQIPCDCGPFCMEPVDWAEFLES